MTREPKYLSGVKRLVSEMLKRDLSQGTAHETENFICDVCKGYGEVSYTKGVYETCKHCNGSGIIKISFEIKRIV